MKKSTLVPALIAASICTFLFASENIGAQESADDQLSLEQEIASLKAELERVSGMLPAQAVAMTVVEYNFSNLWFAAHEGKWPLAQFFLSETRARLRWSLRITPQRRVSTGDLVLQPFLDAFEQPHYAAVERSIQAQDISAFEAAYDNALNACYNCHVASEKAFLRLRRPTVPAAALVDIGKD
jgi:hypothetical protein